MATDMIHYWRWALVLWFAQPVQAGRIVENVSKCTFAQMPQNFCMQVDLNDYIHLLLLVHIGLTQ